MQTIQFIQTVKWIKSQFGEVLIKTLLEREFLYDLRRIPEEGIPEEVGGHVLEASHNLAMVQPKLLSHPWAGSILKAFGLSQLLDTAFPVTLARTIIRRKEGHHGIGEVYEILNGVSRPWRILWGSIDPIEAITTPKEVIEEKDFDDFLTVELRCATNINPTIETVGDILKSVNALYTNIAKLQGAKDAENLTAIYAASGSSFRFDFKGLGEPIKQIKHLLIEGWQAIRHRCAGDLRSNNKATLSGLKVLADIKEKRDKNVIKDEDADKLSQKIVNSMLDLYEKGGLIREIPVVEEVSNQRLIEELQPKRLPAPTPKALPEGEAPKKKVKSKTKKRTKTKTQQEESEEKDNRVVE